MGCVAGPRDLAENRRKYLRTARETTRLTSSNANVRQLRSAHAEIETEIAGRRRNAKQGRDLSDRASGYIGATVRNENGLPTGSR